MLFLRLKDGGIFTVNDQTGAMTVCKIVKDGSGFLLHVKGSEEIQFERLERYSLEEQAAIKEMLNCVFR